MYNNQLFFADMEQTGTKIRLKNKLKAKNLMALSVNFLDKDVLNKVQKLFLDMSPEEMKTFKQFLNGKKYLNKNLPCPKEQAIINKICMLTLNSRPKDEYLRKIMNKYNENLNQIDELKIECTKIIDGKKVNEYIEQINELNDQNIQLYERVNAYRETQS